MPTNFSGSNNGTLVVTSVAGSMGSVSTAANEQAVGSTWVYTFSGVVTTTAASSLSFQVVHTGGTQNIFTVTYAGGALNQNFHGRIVVFWSVVGATCTAVASGYVNYMIGTTFAAQNVSSLLSSYNSTVTNANSCQFVGGANMSYGVQNFTVEYMR
jgi:hypothetical protein